MSERNGADRLCEALTARGVEVVFGLPGSQTVPLYEAFRRAGMRCVNGSHELAASFMANGYARASGRAAVVSTIPGPGFTWALTGLAEARLDSAPVLLVTGAPATGPGRRFQLQALDQAAVCAPLVKSVITVTRREEVGPRTLEALDLTTRGEPGPVVLQVENELWDSAAPGFSPPGVDAPPGPAESQLAAVSARLVCRRAAPAVPGSRGGRGRGRGGAPGRPPRRSRGDDHLGAGRRGRGRPAGPGLRHP